MWVKCGINVVETATSVINKHIGGLILWSKRATYKLWVWVPTSFVCFCSFGSQATSGMKLLKTTVQVLTSHYFSWLICKIRLCCNGLSTVSQDLKEEQKVLLNSNLMIIIWLQRLINTMKKNKVPAKKLNRMMENMSQIICTGLAWCVSVCS